jgi:hypothetical protein
MYIKNIFLRFQKNKFIALLFLFFICTDFLKGFYKPDEMEFYSENNQKYHLSICAVFKNEAKYLKEWIEYHHLLGVDHFYLYNIGSKDSFMPVLGPYIDQETVTLVNWPEALKNYDEKNAYLWALSTQIPAYENAVNFIAKQETKWLVFLDIDEFLVSPKGSITDLLNEYDDCSGLAISSVFFETYKHEIFPDKKLLIQSLDLTSSPKLIVDKSVKKILFKPTQCIGFNWPPYQCRFKDPHACVAVSRKELRINRYINRNGNYSPLENSKPKLDVDNRILPDEMTIEFLAEGYVIEDQERPIFQLIPQLLKRMGH